jgi:hypothetical protein
MAFIKNKFQVNKPILILSFIFCSLYSQSQDSTSTSSINLFEGVVTYHLQQLNPNEKLISDLEFYRDSKNGGKSTVKLFIKGNQYKWEYPDRIEIYLHDKNQIAIFPKNLHDSIYYAPATLADEPMVKIEKSNLAKRISGYELTAYLVTTKWDVRTFFFNPSALKTNPNFWKNHQRDYIGNFIQKSSCFPLMIHQKSLFGNWMLAMSSLESKKLTAEDFALPKK